MRIDRFLKKLGKTIWKEESLDQKHLTALEERIYNNGERLIPGVTHDLAEVVRHRSSYEFFRRVIENDLEIIDEAFSSSKPIEILDLGCGVGHGCYTLSKVRNSRITGVDFSSECLEYANSRYAANNINYQRANLSGFIAVMPKFDYVVSRGVLEHIANGIKLARITKWRYRLLFDVPYDEAGGPNPHHLITGIREGAFSDFPNSELFFEDLSGRIFDIDRKPLKPNMIMCVSSHPDLPKVGSKNISFPIAAWKPSADLHL